MPDLIIEFPAGETRMCKGRNPYHADALVLRHQEDTGTLSLIGRVGSTGGTFHGWTAIPDDSETLRALRDALDAILENRVAPGPEI